MSDEHIVLFDGLNLAHRGYATRLGMLAAIAQNVQRFTETATHAAFIFDSSEGKEKRRKVIDGFNRLQNKTRNKKLEGYKILRPPRPADFITQLKQAESIVRAMGVPVIRSGSGEADDAIATLSHIASQNGYKITVLTNDKDIYPVMQADSCAIYNGQDYLTKREFKRTYGFSPQQWVDFVALRGKHDQVPGVPGIGDATARALVSQYIDIPTIYRNLDSIRYDSEIIFSRLAAHVDLAMVSRKLAALDFNTPRLPSLNALRITPRNDEKLQELLREFKLYRVMARI